MLIDLTPLEELLIAKVHPVLSVYKTKGQQLHYEGHVINFPQDVKSFSRRLPNVEAATNSIITVRKTGQGGNKSHTDFRVRALKVRNALIWQFQIVLAWAVGLKFVILFLQCLSKICVYRI